jgi:hypothetical protein
MGKEEEKVRSKSEKKMKEETNQTIDMDIMVNVETHEDGSGHPIGQ